MWQRPCSLQRSLKQPGHFIFHGSMGVTEAQLDGAFASRGHFKVGTWPREGPVRLKQTEAGPGACKAPEPSPGVCPGGVSRGCVQVLHPGGVSRGCAQGLRLGGVSRGCIQGLRPGAASRVCVQGVRPGAASRVYVQGVHPEGVSRGCVQGLHPGHVSRVCVQGGASRSVSSTWWEEETYLRGTCLSPRPQRPTVQSPGLGF